MQFYGYRSVIMEYMISISHIISQLITIYTFNRSICSSNVSFGRKYRFYAVFREKMTVVLRMAVNFIALYIHVSCHTAPNFGQKCLYLVLFKEIITFRGYAAVDDLRD